MTAGQNNVSSGFMESVSRSAMVETVLNTDPGS